MQTPGLNKPVYLWFGSWSSMIIFDKYFSELPFFALPLKMVYHLSSSVQRQFPEGLLWNPRYTTCLQAEVVCCPFVFYGIQFPDICFAMSFLGFIIVPLIIILFGWWMQSEMNLFHAPGVFSEFMHELFHMFIVLSRALTAWRTLLGSFLQKYSIWQTEDWLRDIGLP